MPSFKFLATAFIGAFLLTGCATKPPYSRILEKSYSPENVDSLTAAALSPATIVTRDQKVKAKLDATNRSISNGGYNSYYQTFEIVTDGAESLSIEIQSYCSCLGLDKRLAIPALLAFDSSGQPIALEDMGYELAPTTVVGFDPFSILLKAKMSTQKQPTVRLIVFADNSRADRTIQDIEIRNQYGTSVLNLAILSYPIGSFALSVSAAK